MLGLVISGALIYRSYVDYVKNGQEPEIIRNEDGESKVVMDVPYKEV